MSLSIFILDRPLYKLPGMSLSFFILDHPLYKLPSMSLSFFLFDHPLYKLLNMSLSFLILDHPLYKLPSMSLSFPQSNVLADPSLAQHKRTEVENLSDEWYKDVQISFIELWTF